MHRMFVVVCPVSQLINRSKTVEVARLQVGDRTDDVKVIVSTVAEAEHLSDFLLTCRESQRSVNVSTTARSRRQSSYPEGPY